MSHIKAHLGFRVLSSHSDVDESGVISQADLSADIDAVCPYSDVPFHGYVSS